MVAIVVGNSLGLNLSSLGTLGQRGTFGSALTGRNGELAYVNAATGNLVLQDRDDVLMGRGLSVPSVRTYNSLGQLTDDNGDNWSLGAYTQQLRLVGTVNTPGSTSHLAAEILAQQAKLDVVIIAYTGGGPAMAGLVTGDVDALFPTGPVAARAMKTGRVRCLGVTTHDKSPSFPDLPPIHTIVPGVEIGNWYAMFFPKGTPSNIVNKLPGLIKKALGEKKISDRDRKRWELDPASSEDYDER